VPQAHRVAVRVTARCPAGVCLTGHGHLNYVHDLRWRCTTGARFPESLTAREADSSGAARATPANGGCRFAFPSCASADGPPLHGRNTRACFTRVHCLALQGGAPSGDFCRHHSRSPVRLQRIPCHHLQALHGPTLRVFSRRGRLAALAVFFRQVTQWHCEGLPAHALLAVGDLPKTHERVPRYIPDAELARLMDTIRALNCPVQRTALLVAR
jgi:hypothetical protein